MSTLNEARNKLYFGDNLDVLRKHIKDESVDLCYIDPPFNSNRNYNQIYNNIGQDDRAQAQAFTDTWEWDRVAKDGLREILENEKGRFTPQTVELIKGLRNVLKESSLLAYLVSMTLRIVEIYRVLKPTGSLYLHCDPTSSHYLKLVLDGVFCSQGGEFLNEIVWQRFGSHNDPKRFGRITDAIFFYSKSNDYIFHPVRGKYSKDHLSKRFRYADVDGRKFWPNTMLAPGGRGPRYEWNGHVRNWRFTKQNMAELDAKGEIYYSAKGMPYRKNYLDSLPGQVIQNLWIDIKMTKSGAERLGYPTQKPEMLLQRIIEASSNEGEVVLDAYCGCGTTVAVAQRLNRQWIGIDITYQSISLILKRLEDAFGADALNNVILDGIPKDIASATALAHKRDDRVRKEFEKWAVLTYSKNRATINQRKGADHGIDGTVYFMATKTDNDKMIFQVKSGGVGEADIRDLLGAMDQQRAPLGVFITLEEPTRPMIKAARAAGEYRHELMGKDYDRIQIVTVKDLIENRSRLEMPLVRDVVKAAAREVELVQTELEFGKGTATHPRPPSPMKKPLLADPKAREKRKQQKLESKKSKTG
jgi:DNA modification methylase